MVDFVISPVDSVFSVLEYKSCLLLSTKARQEGLLTSAQ